MHNLLIKSALLFLLFFTFTTSVSAVYNGEGIGILSDSDSDEYRADDNRGTTYATTTLNWVELLAKYRNLNFGQWGTRAEPRRSGYEYNWARSGQLTRDLIDSGQAAGLANQIQSGDVQFVFIHMGVNDFNFWNNTYQDVYNGTVDIPAKVNVMISKMSQAIDIVKQAGATKIVMTGLGDPNNFPLIVSQFPIKTNRDRVTNAINDVNTGWKAKADASGVLFFDMNQWFMQNIIPKIDVNGTMPLGDQNIQIYVQGDEPHHFRLGDSAGHLGTAANGLVANDWFITVFNTYFNTSITPFSEYQILTNAGINTTLPTSTPLSPTPTTHLPKAGDVNDDGIVNLSDLGTLLGNFGKTGMVWNQGDITGSDTIVNLTDLSTLLANFGK